jgi:hypothetical protein
VDAGALERGEVRDVETEILRAAGDHHGACGDGLAVGETELEPARAGAGPAQPHHFVGYGELGAEFLGLVERSRHQRHTRDAGRKAEVVLDPGRGARLAAEGAAIETDHREPFGSPVDGRRETGRAGSDDGDVVGLRRIDRSNETEAARELSLARIVQQRSVRAEHDRQLGGRDLEAVDQRLRAGVDVGVERVVGMAAAP